MAGHKLWVMFPYECPKWLVNGENFRDKGKKDEKTALDYFHTYLPKMMEKEPKLKERMVKVFCKI